MKRTKKDLSRFSKRAAGSRRQKERALREVRSMLEVGGVDYSGAKIGISEDRGYSGRGASRARGDDLRARGVFSGSKSGFGFVSVEGEARDIFIPEDKTGGAIHGDLVEIVYHSYTSRFGEEKTEGRVVKIIEYGITELVGTVFVERSRIKGKRRQPDRYFLLPDDTKLLIRPHITDTMGAEDGDKAVVKLHRCASHYIECEVVAILGDTFSLEANYEAVLFENGITQDFTEKELSEAREAAALEISPEGRVRIGGSVLTIDGEDAKDLDDAISLRRVGDGWRLGVHIADVSSYVREKTALDRAVMARGTSVYFTDKVVPMLPRELSNGACSLNAGEDKLTLSAIITLDSRAEIVRTELVPSIISSKVRGVYSEVNSLFDGTAGKDIKEKYKSVLPTLRKMRELYLLLRKKAEGRGYMEMEMPEARVMLDAEGTPVGIVRRERGDAEKMIEQFMLTANEGVARLLSERGIPCVYRIHEPPPEEKLSDFLLFAHNLGLDTTGVNREKPDPKELSGLLADAEEKGLSYPVSYSLLRSMSKARYSEIRQSHFGLGLEYYCHFTSPIRRLSDLATHRIIHRVLLEGKPAAAYASYAKRAARAASDAELRALSAERRIEDLYKVVYMSRQLGESFDATVSSITSFGMFCTLENTCEGLVPLSEMPGVFIFDEKNIALRSGSVIYRLGDTVRVRLEEADIIRGKLRFSLVY